ncbi:MAG: TonB-dependent receptor plug domain-containing protein [Persicimonas sp.]
MRTRYTGLGAGVAALLAGVLVAGPVAADEEVDEESDYEVETVAPVERSVEDERLPSGFVSRLELDEESSRGRDLGDALERVPGLDVQRSSGLGGSAFATVRGGNPRQMAVSLNGMRISAPAGVGFDVGRLSLRGLEGADVYRGAAATVHGAGALSGAIDLRTRLPDEAGWRAGASALGGSFETAGLDAHGAAAGEESAAAVDVGYRQGEGDFPFIDDQGTAHRRVNNDHRQLSVLASGRLEVDDHDIEPLVWFDRSAGGAPGPSEFQDEFSEARLVSDRRIAQLGWEKMELASPDWGAVDARARLGYQRRQNDYENPSAYPGESRVEDASVLESIELRGESSAWFDAGNLLHANAGIRHEAYDAEHRVAYPNSSTDSRIDADRTTVAAALFDEWLLADAAVSLVGAVRLEHLSDRSDQLPSTERSWTPVIPSVGAIWRLGDDVELKSNLARTFRAPDLDELYLDLVGVRGDPSLEPERAVSADAGVSFGGSDDPLGLRATLFYNDFRESIRFVARNAYLFEAANVGGGYSRGVESAVEWRPHERVDTLATYTLTDASLDGAPDDVGLPGQPTHRATLRAAAELADLGPLSEVDISSFRLFGEASWRSEVALDTFGNVTNPPFGTADLGFALEPNDALAVTFNARNLTDARRGADLLQRPLPGRAFYVSLSVDSGE